VALNLNGANFNPLKSFQQFISKVDCIVKEDDGCERRENFTTSVLLNTLKHNMTAGTESEH
jgi:hypothetical protein